MRIFHRYDPRRRTAAAAGATGGPVVARVTRPATPPEPLTNFAIAEGERTTDAHTAIPPDVATCAQCVAEIRNPTDRRFNYAFTNCANCGPRFTIATAAPYARANTTMSRFPMCDACRREYDDVANRRFQAEANACPLCGPTLLVINERGAAMAESAPIATAAAAIHSGLIVAVKGIGGYHLACDATSAVAVERLRQRKHRDEKPFAVMVRDLAEARKIAHVTIEEAAALQSIERPIVLVTARADSGIAEAVAPANPLLGLMLPYSPLHHLLLDAAQRPLVMTSGNMGNEPIAIDDRDAFLRLHGIADLFLSHDRAIASRCDDSVVRVINRAPVLLRRSRGYVPRALPLPMEMETPVLACGALLKNAFCLARGREAVLGPHVGNLETVETCHAFRQSIDRLQEFLGITPRVVAHDLHPGYLSTKYAETRQDVLRIPVQHHHAHIASVMAEHGAEGPVIGVAYDAGGLGTDGASWGAEVMVTSYRDFTRLATFRPIALPGGDAAVHEPWRLALALVDDAFGGEAPLDQIRVFDAVRSADLDVMRQMVRTRVHAPMVHGMGRYFDAIGALGLGRPFAGYEGQVALEWNLLADPQERGRYRYDIIRGALWQVDLRAMVRDAVFELIGGEPAACVSARFHNTVAAATADLVRGIAQSAGRLPVALSGGCFQNARLVESIVAELSPEFEVLTHRQVPPGDGGLALGQAVVANAIARKMRTGECA